MGLEDDELGDPVCVVCKVAISDPRSLLPCSQCRSCFHQSGCSGISDFRGFHNKRATWTCSSCDSSATEQSRKRQRSESGETIVIDTDVFKELLETIKSLNSSVIELKNEVAGVKGELVEVRKINQNLVDKLSFIEKKKADKEVVSFAEVAAKNLARRQSPRRQPSIQPKQSQKLASASNVTVKQVNTAVNSALENVNNDDNIDDGFRSASSRKKRFRKPTVIGELVSKDESAPNHFEGTERRHWVYIGRVKSGTTAEAITCFVKSTWKIDDVLCNQLASHDGISSFKVGVRESHIPSLLDGAKWPKGVAVREFVFIPKRGADFANSETGNFQNVAEQAMQL